MSGSYTNIEANIASKYAVLATEHHSLIYTADVTTTCPFEVNDVTIMTMTDVTVRTSKVLAT